MLFSLLSHFNELNRKSFQKLYLDVLRLKQGIDFFLAVCYHIDSQEGRATEGRRLGRYYYV